MSVYSQKKISNGNSSSNNEALKVQTHRYEIPKDNNGVSGVCVCVCVHECMHTKKNKTNFFCVCVSCVV